MAKQIQIAKGKIKNKEKTPLVRNMKSKYRLLHVPSGQYLKLSNLYGSYREAKKAIYGFTSLTITISNLISSNSINLYRQEPVFTAPMDDIILYIPETSIKIGTYIPSTLQRIDYIAFDDGIWPYGSPSDSLWKASLEELKQDPYIYINLEIMPLIYLDDRYYDDSSEIRHTPYRVLIENTSSWDTVMMELWTYLQHNKYAITLKQFSKDGLTDERVLLTEFEIVQI